MINNNWGIIVKNKCKKVVNDVKMKGINNKMRKNFMERDKGDV